MLTTAFLDPYIVELDVFRAEGAAVLELHACPQWASMVFGLICLQLIASFSTNQELSADLKNRQS